MDYSASAYSSIAESLILLHHELAPTEAALDLIMGHCEIVADIAVKFAKKYMQKYVQKNALISAPGSATDLVSDSVSDSADEGEASGTDRADGAGAGANLGIYPDIGLIAIGGLAHDIGSYSVFDPSGNHFDHKRYILHGINGYHLLLDRGYGEQIAQFARNHTGVGITADDVVRQHLPLPVADYLPKTVEQEIVMYADKFHTKSQPPRFLTDEEALASAVRFGDDNARRFLALRLKYGMFAEL
jgi:uncharacterized protein